MILRFATFEFDSEQWELRRDGVVLALRGYGYFDGRPA